MDQPSPPEPQALTPEEERALEALLSHPTQAEAAAACGLTARTLRTWLAQKPYFLEAYRAARREVMEACRTRIQSATAKAVQTLEDVMDSGDTSSSRVAAARAILETAFKSVEQAELVERMEKLEASQAESLAAQSQGRR